MSVIAKASANIKLAEIPLAVTAGVQAAQQLAAACVRVNGLWQDAKTANQDDEEWLSEAYVEFGQLCGQGWGDAKPSLESAFDILAGGVGLTRNDLLDQLRTS